MINLFTPQVSAHSLVMTDEFVVYLTRSERAKNILQNEVASDFVFILKMRKIHGTSIFKMT